MIRLLFFICIFFSAAIGEDSESIITLNNGQIISGDITEVNELFIKLDNQNTILYKVISTIRTKDESHIQIIREFFPDVLIEKQIGDEFLLKFTHTTKVNSANSDSTPEKKISDIERDYSHRLYIGGGAFLSPREESVGFLLKLKYAQLVKDRIIIGGFISLNDWWPNNKLETDEIAREGSSNSNLLQFMPTVSVIGVKWSKKTDPYLQLGLGYSIYSGSEFTIKADSTVESNTIRNEGNFTISLGVGLINYLSEKTFLSLNINYHVVFRNKQNYEYLTIDLGYPIK